jgi:hypothetical protein
MTPQAAAPGARSPAFLAGAAQADITPPAGAHLAGSGAGLHRPAEFVLDPLRARATVFEAGGRRVCLLALDVTIITRPWSDRIRRAAVERWGFDPAAVLVCATQTHSAPAIGHFMFDPDFPDLPGDIEYLRGGETAYAEFACARAVEAIGAAVEALRPARLGAGRAARDGLAFNRRAILRDGRVGMPWFYSSLDKPLGPTDIVCLEGPVDPEVGVLCARDDALRPLALLLHYTCHPVNVYALPGQPEGVRAVSADWPGAWAEAMRAALGGGACDGACAPLVLNGCCGNLNPWPAFEPDFKPDHRRMGRALADSARAVLQAMRFEPADRVDWRERRVALPLKPPDPDRLDAARRMLEAHPAPLWSREQPGLIDPAWFQAASVMSVELMRRRGPALDYEVQAMRVGDAAIVGLPGEPFVEGQLAIKLASPARLTLVAHAASEYVGYLPTREAFRRGGHEVDFSYWAKLAPEALDLAADAAIELLRELWR